MKNEKGILPIVVCFLIAFGAVAVVAIAHIPAWERAKANHTEAAYQAAR